MVLLGHESKPLRWQKRDIYNIAAMPQKMGSEIRKERYERAIKWLEGVQAGKIIPDLPLATDEDGTPTGDLLIFGSQKQLRHNW